MGACKEATAEALFQNIHRMLLQSKVLWDNCVCLVQDNKAVKILGIALHPRLQTRISLAKNLKCDQPHFSWDGVLSVF